VVAAPSVQANVGGNLTIESLQDQDHYDSQQHSLGGSLTFGAGMMGGSLSASQSKINSDYLSVGEQSGILAGDGGFHVKVGGDTTLTGGVISSTETAVQQQNNQFATGGTLAMTDLHNQADYNDSSTSLNVGTSMSALGAWSPAGSGIGFGNDSGSASSDTRSGISGIAGNSAARTGDPQSGIQRIFDADKVQQDIDAQTRITQTFGQQASSAVGKYAEKKMETAIALTEQANQARANGQNDLADQLSAQASQINSEWGENGSYRIGLHTVIGGLTGGAAGAAGSLTGSLTAVEASRLLNENGITQENNPALYNTLVTLASTAAGGVVGGTAGAGTAFNEVTNNWLFTEKENEKYKKAKAECGPANKAACDTKKALEDLSFKRLAVSEPLKESHPEALYSMYKIGGVITQAALGAKFIGAGLGAGVNFGYQFGTVPSGQSVDWSGVALEVLPGGGLLELHLGMSWVLIC
jgi:filamentous hemagglutinin